MKLKKLIAENPDVAIMVVKKGDTEYEEEMKWSDYDSFVFGYYNDKMYIENEGNHMTLHWNIPKKDILPEDDTPYWNRNKYKYPGRVWAARKVITFWEYPPKYMLTQIMKDLRKAGIPMGKLDNWNIEVVDKQGKYEAPEPIPDYDVRGSERWVGWSAKTVGKSGGKIKYVRVKDYIGSEKQVGREIQHMLSPKLKKNVVVPYGAGSRKKVSGALPGEIPAATRFRMKKGLGDGVIKLKSLIVEKHEDKDIIASPGKIDKRTMILVVFPEHPKYKELVKYIFGDEISATVPGKNIIVIDGNKADHLTEEFLIFIEAHEIAHQLLKHKPKTMSDWKQEIEADYVAYNILKKHHYNKIAQKAKNAITKSLKSKFNMSFEEFEKKHGEGNYTQ